MVRKTKMNKYSVDYSANHIVNTTTTNAKYDQADGKNHSDYGDEITYEQVLEYCEKRNYALVDREYYFHMIGENPIEVWGVPIDEAQRVIEAYKYTHKVPSKDYQEGFEDGVKYMRELQNSIVADQLRTLLEKENETN